MTKDKLVTITSHNQTGGITAHTVNIGVQKELEHRQVSPEQLKILETAIKGIKPESLLVLTFDSHESQQYSHQFEAVLRRAGWIIEHLMLGRGTPGGAFRVGWNTHSGRTSGYEALVAGLKAAGFEIQDGEFEANCSHAVSLDVGLLTMTPYQRAVDKIQ